MEQGVIIVSTVDSKLVGFIFFFFLSLIPRCSNYLSSKLNHLEHRYISFALPSFISFLASLVPFAAVGHKSLRPRSLPAKPALSPFLHPPYSEIFSTLDQKHETLYMRVIHHEWPKKSLDTIRRHIVGIRNYLSNILSRFFFLSLSMIVHRACL